METNDYMRMIGGCEITKLNTDADLGHVLGYCRNIMEQYKRSERSDGINAYLEAQSLMVADYLKRRERLLMLEHGTDADVLNFILVRQPDFEKQPPTIEELASELGIPLRLFQDVLAGEAEFTREDIAFLCQHLELPVTVFDFSKTCGVTPGRYKVIEQLDKFVIVDRETKAQIPVPESLEELYFDYNDETETIQQGHPGYLHQMNVRLRSLDDEIRPLVVEAFAEAKK